MISSISPPSSTQRVLLLLAIVCLLATFTGVIFVGAHNDDNNLPPSTATDQVAAAGQNAAAKTRLAEQFGKLPLSFEINKGQIDGSVKFLSHGPGYDLFLTATEAVLRVQKPPTPPDKSKQTAPANADVREGTVLRLRMLGASTTPQAEGQDQLPGKIHYFTGNDPAKWQRNVPTYKRAYFKDVYPGIDVVYYGKQRELEYDFVVAPGADPKLIRFTVEGAEQIRLDKTGRLVLNLKHGEVSLYKPVIYQLNENGSRNEVRGAYFIKGKEVRFKLERFDSSKQLVIDPVLSYSTLLGSGNNDQAFGIAVDAQGNAYVTGQTDGTTFPTTAGAFKTTSTRSGAFVTKLNSSGSALIYSTYLSGEGNTNGTSIAVDSSGNAHVTGTTSARDFPIANGLKTTSNFFKTTDAAANWNNQNSGLVGDMNVMAVAPNAANTIYAATNDGFYRSADGGATWTKTTSTGLSSPTFVSALAVDPSNSSVLFCGLFSQLFKSTNGGDTWTTVNTSSLNIFSVAAIVFDPATPSTMYLGAGNGVFKSTDSGATWIAQNNFSVPGTPNVRSLVIDPTTPLTLYAGTSGHGLFKSTNGGGVWTAMNNGMGGPSPTSVNVVVIDPANPATLYTGHGSGGINKSTNGASSWTLLTNEVPQGQINAMLATSSAVYAAISNNGVIKSTNGGANWASANAGLWSPFVRAIVVRPGDPSVVYAGTGSAFFTDAFVTKLNASGSGLLFSTLLGGSNEETGNGIAVDGTGNIYATGQTTSFNYPLANPVQSAPPATKSCFSGFVTKLNPAVPSYVFSTYLRGSQCDTANSVAVDSAGSVYVTGTTGSTDFLIANAFQPSFSGQQFGGSDAFVTKLTSAGALTYSTYLGGTGAETGFGIAADSSGNAYITGFTNSTNFPTLNPIQANSGGNFNTDVFVTKLNSSGSALVYSTYLGGSAGESGRGIAVDSANNAYVAGFSDSPDFPLVAGALRTKSAMYKSVDGAANWSNDNYGFAGAGANNFGFSSITALAIHPGQPSVIYAGSGNGVFKSTNGGRTWSAMNNGLASRNVTALVIDPSVTATLYVAVSSFSGSGVYKSTDGGSTWNLRNNGITQTELISLALDPAAPNTLYLGVSFCCVVGPHIYKTTDGADNWAPLPSTTPLVPTSIVIDPLNHLTLYAADAVSPGAVYKSIDAGATWQNLGLPSNSPARSVAASPLTAGLVYAGTDIGLFRSVDGGTNWTQIPSLSGKIVFDPVSAATVYALTSPFASAQLGLMKSTDNGQTWVPMNKGLNLPQAVVLAIDPQNPSTLHLGSTPPNGSDAFVTKINPAGSALLYSTFVGGSPSPQSFSNTITQAFGIALDSSGNAYITGSTSSSGFPATPESYQPFNRGFNDAFISKLGVSYLISGRVLNNGAPGSPLAGAEVVLNDGTSLTNVFTESDGSYQFSRLREGGNYTVSAAKPHFTMTPASQTFNNLNSDQVLDFSALTSDAEFRTISGQVTENGATLAGVKVTLGGSQSGLRTTDSSGNYSFQLIVAGNYTVTPSGVGFTFGPVSQTFNNLQANQTANFAAARQNFVVTNANNHGSGSLRDAIVNANATIGTDTITFNIPGPGVKTINLQIALPEITDRVVIDATTQPGYAGSPLIEINGSGAGFNANGLAIKAGGSTVRGLSIGGFSNGNGILLNSNNNLIQGNYLGIAADGSTARPNTRGIQITNASNNIIGGTTGNASRNVISGNGSSGIEITGNANVVQGNFIGTNATGNAAVGNSGGISIFNVQSDTPSLNNLIGGTAVGAGNVISGNQFGVSTSGKGTTIQGNRIGLDSTGTVKVPNTSGVQATGEDVLIGGLTPEARNIISGNNSDGVFIRGAGNKLQGNYIGTDISGGFALGNSGNGVVAGDNALIGGTEPGARNVIAGNGNFGNVVLGFNGAGSSTTVQGNYIGTDATGTRALGGSSAGINILSNNHTIGGTVEAARNVISGNAIGIQLGGFFGGTVGNVIQGNFIGLNAAGNAPLPNLNQGIAINDAVNNTIGGTQNGAGNKIAFNIGPGVTLQGTANGISIRGNAIFSNNGLGIDLLVNGVTPNDGNDSDTGPNQLQNFPVITSVTSASNSTTIQGSLKSIPSTTFQVDFYSNSTVDPSGNGEGAQFFGTTAVNTNANGDGNINVTLPTGLSAGRVISATATDPNGNTSEFSAADATASSGSVQFSMTSLAVIEDIGSLPVTVLRTGGSTGSLSVDYATTNGSAIAGQDYTSTSGTLTFGPGETSKTISIPILDDATTEADEFFTVSLSNTPSLESLGAPNSLLITIQDKTTTPILTVTQNVTVTEGNIGSTVDAPFLISLSAATGRAVSVNFATANLTAFGGPKCNNAEGVDYVSASGTLSFTPGTTSLLIPIKICGDTSAEANESFRIILTNASGATVFNNQGFGTIINDDVLGLLLEESGPDPNQAAALEAILGLRDPFPLFMPEWYTPGISENTRVVLFAQNLQLNPGETSTAVIVRLQSNIGQIFQVQAEDVRPLRDTEFTQVIIRLPNILPPGTYNVTILAHTRLSNAGTIRIVP